MVDLSQVLRGGGGLPTGQGFSAQSIMFCWPSATVQAAPPVDRDTRAHRVREGNALTGWTRELCPILISKGLLLPRQASDESDLASTRFRQE